MNPFVEETEVDRIELVDGEWIDIKRRLAYQDSDLLTSDDIKDIQGNSSAVPLLKMCIVAWSFKDEQGQPVPITVERLRRLDIGIGAKIMEQIRNRVPFV